MIPVLASLGLIDDDRVLGRGHDVDSGDPELMLVLQVVRNNVIGSYVLDFGLWGPLILLFLHFSYETEFTVFSEFQFSE